MEIRLIKIPIRRSEVEAMAKATFGEMVKAVVDVKRGIMTIQMELHADGEMLLLENGSVQTDLWGINLYPGKSAEEWVEFDSMINVRPRENNRSRSVEDPAIQSKIRSIVNTLVI
ncbi:MAG: DUF5674 family protein [Methanobacteriota archaeon]